jgi:hypothetical protein
MRKNECCLNNSCCVKTDCIKKCTRREILSNSLGRSALVTIPYFIIGLIGLIVILREHLALAEKGPIAVALIGTLISIVVFYFTVDKQIAESFQVAYGLALKLKFMLQKNKFCPGQDKSKCCHNVGCKYEQTLIFQNEKFYEYLFELNSFIVMHLAPVTKKRFECFTSSFNSAMQNNLLCDNCNKSCFLRKLDYDLSQLIEILPTLIRLKRDK